MVDLIERDLILRYFRYLKDKFRNKEGPLEYLMKKLIEYIEKVPYPDCDGCIYDELIASVCSECCRNYHDEYQPKEDKDG